jgi:hypothetical protein
MENKQTAVDYLLSFIWAMEWVDYTEEEKNKILKKAKQIEQEQIEDAFQYGRWDCFEKSADGHYKDPTEYYRETYGNTENPDNKKTTNIKFDFEELNKKFGDEIINDKAQYKINWNEPYVNPVDYHGIKYLDQLIYEMENDRWYVKLGRWWRIQVWLFKCRTRKFWDNTYKGK